MFKPIVRLATLLTAFSVSTAAFAQGAVRQVGPVTAGHAAVWNANGQLVDSSTGSLSPPNNWTGLQTFNGNLAVPTLTTHGLLLGEGVSPLGSVQLSTGELLIGQGAASDPQAETMSGDATIAANGALTLTTVNSNIGACGTTTAYPIPTLNAKGLATGCTTQALGTFAFQNYASPPAIGSGTPNTGAFTTLSASGSLTLGAITGSTQCLQVSAAGVVSGTGGGCGGSPLGVANTWTALQTFNAGISTPTISGLTTPLSQAQGGTGATSIGTAAFSNTGTSGNAVPLLNAANAWSAKQSFAPSTTAGAGVNFAPGVAPTSPTNGDAWAGNTLGSYGLNYQNGNATLPVAVQSVPSIKTYDPLCGVGTHDCSAAIDLAIYSGKGADFGCLNITDSNSTWGTGATAGAATDGVGWRAVEKNGVVFMGCGMATYESGSYAGAGTLITTENTSKPFIQFGPGANFITLRDFTLSRSGYTPTTGGDGIVFQGDCDWCTITNLLLFDQERPLVLNQASNSFVTDVSVANCYSHCVAFTGSGPEQWQLRGVTATNSNQFGFYAPVPVTATFTGSITNGVMTVASAPSSPLAFGETIAGAGITAGTTISSQLTGTVGGIGTYSVSGTTVAASTTITASSAGIILGPWQAVNTFGNAAGGIGLFGNASGLVSDFRCVQCFLGGDGSNTASAELAVNYATNVQLQDSYLEYAGDNATGVDNGTAQGKEGYGVVIDANSSNVQLTGNTINFMAYNGILTSGTNVLIQNNRVYNNGYWNTGSDDGIVVASGTASLTGNWIGNDGGSWQTYGVAVTGGTAVQDCGNTFSGNASGPWYGTVSTFRCNLYTGTIPYANIGTIFPTPLDGDRIRVSDATTCTFNTVVNVGGGGTPCRIEYLQAISGWVAY